MAEQQLPVLVKFLFTSDKLSVQVHPDGPQGKTEMWHILRADPGAKIAAGFRGEEAFEAGVGEDQAFDTVLPWLSEERCRSLASECLELYCWDRLGAEN